MIAAAAAAHVVMGSAYGPVALLDAAGAALLVQLRKRGIAFVPLSRRARAGQDVTESVADEVGVVRRVAGRCRGVLASVEDAPAAAELLAVAAAAAASGRVDVRLCTERQDRLAGYLLIEGARRGISVSSADVVTFEHDHANSLAMVTRLPFVASANVVPYEFVHAGSATWVDETLALVGLRGRLDLRALREAGVSARTAYSTVGLELGRQLLPELNDAAEYELLHEFLLDTFPAAGDGLLPDPLRERLVDRHRDVNRAFFAAHLPALPADSYADAASTAALARIPDVVTVPGPALRTRARKVAGRGKRAVLRRVARDGLLTPTS